MSLKVKKLRSTAKLPSKGTNYAAGFDLFLEEREVGNEPYVLLAHKTNRFPTGLAMEIPEGMFGHMRPRSSAFLKGLQIEGVIDSDYRGETYIMIRNSTDTDILLEPGKAYAQLVLMKYENEPVSVVEDLSYTDRGDGGFGSTGNH